MCHRKAARFCWRAEKKGQRGPSSHQSGEITKSEGLSQDVVGAVTHNCKSPQLNIIEVILTHAVAQCRQWAVMLCSMQSFRNPVFFHPLRFANEERERMWKTVREGLWVRPEDSIKNFRPHRTQSHGPISLQGKLRNISQLHSQEGEKQSGEHIALSLPPGPPSMRVDFSQGAQRSEMGKELFSAVPVILCSLTHGSCFIPSLFECSESPASRPQLLLIRETLCNGT